MLGRISRKLLSRRNLKEGQSFSHQTTSSQYAQTPGSESRGDVLLSSGEDRIQWLHCANQAHLPARDAKILESQGGSPHLFTALITTDSSAQGGNYLRRNMHRELLKQVAALGDIPKAFRGAMFALDRAWRDMHPFNHNVLDGVSLAAAYVDLNTDTLYVASTGGCRVLVGSRSAAGNLQITTDVGENEGSRGLAGGIATVQLTEDVDSIILGSAGLWRELTPEAAMLRLEHYHDCTRWSGNGAAHLANYALHKVTQRTQRQRDPRMRALQEPSDVQSLWVGDVSNYKWGGKQPVRRRRGDVHDDISAMVLHMDWSGRPHSPLQRQMQRQAQGPYKSLSTAMPKCASTNTIRSPVTRAEACWRLLRMHFLEHRRAERTRVQRQWMDVLSGVLAQHKLGTVNKLLSHPLSRLPSSAAVQLRVDTGASFGQQYVAANA